MKTTLKIIVIILILVGFGFGIYTIAQNQERKKLLEEIKVIIASSTSLDEKQFFEPYIKKFEKLSIKELKLVKKYVGITENNSNGITESEKIEILALIQKGYLPMGT